MWVLWVFLVVVLTLQTVPSCGAFPSPRPGLVPPPGAGALWPGADTDIGTDTDTDTGTGTDTGGGVWPAGACGACEPELCPESRGCRAGLVPEPCGCCMECGNLEGQACDPGGKSLYYGLCGTGLRCQPGGRGGGGRGGGEEEEEEEEEEEVCVCEEQEPVCGSDGVTYMNMCQFREKKFTNPEMTTRNTGACRTVPVIKVCPVSQVNGTGSSVLFLCEVFAYPMAVVEWRRDGEEVVLPGDDPHVSVQSRGGPLRFELSSWLQIEGAEPTDSGTYRCTARNDLGSVSASAELGILGAEELSSYLAHSVSEMQRLLEDTDYEQDFH